MFQIKMQVKLSQFSKKNTKKNSLKHQLVDMITNPNLFEFLTFAWVYLYAKEYEMMQAKCYVIRKGTIAGI